MRMSSQAKRLADALAALGIARRDYRVRTETFVRQGDTYYGEAVATFKSPAARDMAYENAGALKEAGFRVWTHDADGHRAIMVMS